MTIRENSKRSSYRVKRSRGATMVEYCLLAALIATIALVSIRRAGKQVDCKWKSISDSMAGNTTVRYVLFNDACEIAPDGYGGGS